MGRVERRAGAGRRREDEEGMAEVGLDALRETLLIAESQKPQVLSIPATSRVATQDPNVRSACKVRAQRLPNVEAERRRHRKVQLSACAAKLVGA
jgi:hypothetical protein